MTLVQESIASSRRDQEGYEGETDQLPQPNHTKTPRYHPNHRVPWSNMVSNLIIKLDDDLSRPVSSAANGVYELLLAGRGEGAGSPRNDSAYAHLLLSY